MATPNEADIAGEEKGLEGQSVSKEDPPPAAVVPKVPKAPNDPNDPESLTLEERRDSVAQMVEDINVQLKKLLKKTIMMLEIPEPLLKKKKLGVVSTMIPSRRAPKLKRRDVRRVIMGLAAHRAHLHSESIINHHE
ncbi:uncharacterized protein LOC117147652 [Drosophila mauritiana]|uniref:Uncharacterized protein LOC117147652 n=1 Tax=Drosophila mauritiana TaxID=7226 RepID=A0A6P8KUS5_DROMA|nr:uncharacterized protein LOC117147652 [Drosophila mauritiana]